MLHYQRTEEYQKITNELWELKKQKYTMEDEIKKLENRLKELDFEAKEKVRKEYIRMRDEWKEKLGDEPKLFLEEEQKFIFNAEYEGIKMFCVLDLDEDELYQYFENELMVYEKRSYEEALDCIKDDAYSNDNIVRDRWVDDVRYNYENCSLEDYMYNLDVGDFDKEDLKENVYEPGEDIYEILDNMSEKINYEFDIDENFFDRDQTIDLSEPKKE